MKRLKINKHIVILSIIFILAIILRFYKLGSNPRGAMVDEASFGYIAYSLAETGRDEHGVSWPLVFKAFGDDKLPLQAYLMTPVIKILGLNNFSIRFISALSGSLLSIVVYFLLEELIKDKRISLIGALTAALSPWSLVLSRFGYESNLGLLIFSASLIFLFRYLNKKQLKDLYLWIGLMALSWYAYIAYRLLTGLFFIAVVTILWLDKLIKVKEAVGLGGLFGFLVSPLLLLSSSSNTTRLDQLLSNEFAGLELEIIEQRTFCAQQFPQKICYAIANKPLIWMENFINRYLFLFSPSYLVIKGEEHSPYLSVKDRGPVVLVHYLLVVLGLISSFFYKLSTQRKIVLLGTLLAPLASLLVGYPQKVRMSAFLIFLFIWLGYGLKLILDNLKGNLANLIMAVTTVGLVVLSGVYYINFLGVHTQRFDKDFSAHLPVLFKKIEEIDSDHLVVVKPFFSDPILFYAYYNQIDPQHYQTQVKLGELEASGFQHAVGLDNLVVADVSAKRAACLGYEQGREAIYVTDAKQERMLPITSVKSINQVHDYVFFYDVTEKYSIDDCANLSNNQ